MAEKDIRVAGAAVLESLQALADYNVYTDAEKAKVAAAAPGNFATAAQGAKADTALQPADASSFATSAQGAKADSALQPADASNFASSAQGAKADTALQPADASSFATSAQGAKADSAVQPGALGTAAAANTGDFATAAQGAKADTALQPADASSYATAAQGATADSAVQPGDLATVATSGAYTDLSGKPTIPSNLNDLSDIPAGASEGSILVYRSGSYAHESKPVSSGTPAWGDITGTLSGQTDLQNALDAKAATSHTHSLANITDAGTAAAANTGDFATAAQGAKADSAVQPGALAAYAPKAAPLVELTASRNSAGGDSNAVVWSQSGSALTLTYNNTLAEGEAIEIRQLGTGAITIAGSVNPAPGMTLVTAGQYSVAMLRRVNNTVVLSGDLVAA